MMNYLFGGKEKEKKRERSPPPPPAAAVKRTTTTTTTTVKRTTKQSRNFGDGSSIGSLKCGASDDLNTAYDDLLETFDEEQTRFGSALSSMEKEHGEAMSGLAEARDALHSKLEAKQSTFDASLTELEVKLTALLRKRIESMYGAKMAESSGVLRELDAETRQKDIDIDALQKMYAELLARLEQQRSDHAHHVANAARDALAQQKTMAEQKLSVTRSAFASEVEELQKELASLEAAGLETRRLRAAELNEQRASFANALRLLMSELSSQFETFLPVLESITGRRPAWGIFKTLYLAEIELVFHDS